MNIVERAKAPTPKFFRILRSIGLALLGISGTIIAAPIILPVAVITAAGYAAVAGGVISAISQITVDTSTNSLQANQNEGSAKDDKENLNKARDGN